MAKQPSITLAIVFLIIIIAIILIIISMVTCYNTPGCGTNVECDDIKGVCAESCDSLEGAYVQNLALSGADGGCSNDEMCCVKVKK